MKDYNDQKAKELVFELGQRIWVYTPRTRKELSKTLMQSWLGPYRNVEKFSPVHFKLHMATNKSVAISCHANRMNNESYSLFHLFHLSVIFRCICSPQMDLSIIRLFLSRKSKNSLNTPHTLTPFLLRYKQNCTCWFLSLVSTLYLHQIISLRLGLCVTARIKSYKKNNLVCRVCVLCYIQVEFVLQTNVLYASPR